MYYRLDRPEIVQSTSAHGEWEKLLHHAGEITWHEVIVGPPYKEQMHRAWVIEVPDWVAAFFAERVAQLIFAAPLRAGESVLPRPEWEHQALLLPPPGGVVIPTGLLNDEWASAHLELHMTHTEKRGTLAVGRLRYAAADEDDERVSVLARAGWNSRPPAIWQRALFRLAAGRKLLQRRAAWARLAGWQQHQHSAASADPRQNGTAETPVPGETERAEGAYE